MEEKQSLEPQDEYFGYARKSPDDKEDTKTSITNQCKLIEETCKINNWKLVEIFIDNSSSGSDRNRRYFTEMIDKLKKSQTVKGIVSKHQERIARDSSFFRDTLVDLDAYKKRIYSIIQKKFLSHEDLGDAVISMVDDNYVVTQRKKANILLEQKQRESLPPIKAPFGYKFNAKKEWVTRPKDAEIVIQTAQDLVNGIDYKITIERMKIDKSKYYRIVKGILKGSYSGFVMYDKKIRDSKKQIVRVEEVSYKGLHTPIITEELWQEVQKKMLEKKQK